MTSRDVIVKVTTQHPEWPFLRQTEGGAGRWGRFQFLVDDATDCCDFWVVCDGLPAEATVDCRPGGTLLVTWEPPTGVRPSYARDFTDQFDRVITCHPKLRHRDVRRGLQGHPWFVGRSYDELHGQDLPAKSVPLVIISSDKAFSSGHRRRLEFALALKDRFGSDAQLVGRGLAEFDDKWDVLAPARYAVAAENAVYDDWLTEKLPDCYLAGAFPLYHGAPNADRYFDPASYARIDIDDLDGTTRLLERLLADVHHYESSRDRLATARDTYLDQLQLFPLLARTLEPLCTGSAAHRPRTLQPEGPPSVGRRLVAKWQKR